MYVEVFRADGIFGPRRVSRQIVVSVRQGKPYVGCRDARYCKFPADNSLACAVLDGRMQDCPYAGKPPRRGVSAIWRWSEERDFNGLVYAVECGVCGFSEDKHKETANELPPKHPLGHPILVARRDWAEVSSGLGYDLKRGVITRSNDPGTLLILTKGSTRTLTLRYMKKHFRGAIILEPPFQNRSLAVLYRPFSS